METNFNAIIDKLMKIKRIKNRVEELKLNKKQIMEALPILIDMSEEKDDKNTKYLTSFYLNENNEIKRRDVRSTYWSKFSYLENIKSLNFENIDFEDNKKFIKEESRKVVINRIKKYLDESQYIKGFYLYGDMGIGKTFLLKKIAKKLAENKREVAFITVPNFASKIKTMFNDDEGRWELINLLKSIDFLFVDDIGAEKINGWFRDEILFSILNERMQNEKTTFFSSNYSFDKLEKIESKTYGAQYFESDKSARLLSRIRALSDELLLFGTNKRF